MHSLVSTHCPDSIFVPHLVGFNLEHLLDGRDMAEHELFFEPRLNPMEVEQLSEQSAMIHQNATPTLGVQSMSTFTLRAPHYIDVDLRIVLRADKLTHDYLLAFYASYIEAPDDRGMHFLGRPRVERVGEAWQTLSTVAHDIESTVVSAGIEPEMPHTMSRPTLAFSYSPLAWTRPFFYGRWRDMVFALMFEPGHDLRLCHSPVGGGRGVNPAWDFQWVLHEPEVDREYQLRGRAIYKPWVSPEDILREYEQWDPLLS